MFSFLQQNSSKRFWREELRTLNRSWTLMVGGEGNGFFWKSKREEQQPLQHLSLSLWCLVQLWRDLPSPLLTAQAMSEVWVERLLKLKCMWVLSPSCEVVKSLQVTLYWTKTIPWWDKVAFGSCGSLWFTPKVISNSHSVSHQVMRSGKPGRLEKGI